MLNFLSRKDWIEVEINNQLTEQEQYARDNWGWIPIYPNTKLKCKVCDLVYSGNALYHHTQTMGHIESRKQLRLAIELVDKEFCEGCPNLLKTVDPYKSKIEVVCRLGFGYEYLNDFVPDDIVYEIDEDMIRPQDCIEHGMLYTGADE